jgi:predicted PurR-regulated permease PerM
VINPEAGNRERYIAITVTLILIVILVIVSFVIVRPFLAPLAWGVILAIATWPAFARCRQRLGGRATLAAVLMTLLLVVVLLGPLAVIVTAISDNVAALGDRLHAVLHDDHVPPAFLARVPLIGTWLTERWRELAANPEEAREMLRLAIQWLLGIAAALGGGIVQLALSIFCAFFFYRDGEAALHRLTDIFVHVAGERARHLLSVAYGTLKGVVYGVMGAAFAQMVLAAFGYWLAGLPAPFLLGLATGFFGIVPGGAAIVWLPAAIWLFQTGEIAWLIFLVLWSAVLVGNVDNVIRPLFISRGGALPLLVVLIGILGGAMAFGFIGIFLGPTILAILFALMREWSPGDVQQKAAGPDRPPPAP